MGGLPTSETCLVVPAPVRPRKLKRQRSQVLPATPKESPRSEEARTFRGHVPLPAALGWRLRASGRKPLCSALCPPHPVLGCGAWSPCPSPSALPLRRGALFLYLPCRICSLRLTWLFHSRSVFLTKLLSAHRVPGCASWTPGCPEAASGRELSAPPCSVSPPVHSSNN